MFPNFMQNKILSQVSLGSQNIIGQYYLDLAAELSVVNRFNHHQVDSKGRALVYDVLITATPQLSQKMIEVPGGASFYLEKDFVNIQTKTAPNTWQTRNAVKAIHRSREDLRRASGVSKKSIGKYAKTLRLNMDHHMFGVAYDRALSSGAAYERIYALENSMADAAGAAGTNPWVGGVWDYSQLTQVEYDAAAGPETQADAFFVNICGGHGTSAVYPTAAPGPYDFISALMAYNQRRQTVFDSATATAGGDTQFIVDDSPLFRIVDKDIAEDEYTAITLDEQDNPPYDRQALATATVNSDSLESQPVDLARFVNQNGLTSMSWRVQAPLGIIQLDVEHLLANTVCDFEFEVMATYPME